MTRIVVVDLLCGSPYYCGPLAGALRAAGADAELASPRFYLEPDYLDAYPRAPWVRDLAVHVPRPRLARVAVRAVEVMINTIRLLQAVRSGTYDVVHVQWVPLDQRTDAFMRQLRKACDRSGTTLVVTAHNAMPHDDPDGDPKVVRSNLDLADVVVAQTDHVVRELVDQVGVETPATLIPHPPLFVDQDPPSRSEAVDRLRTRDVPTVLFLGLMRTYKGIDLLADAWPLVKVAIPEARLLVVGKIHDAAARPDIERLRALHGVDVVDRYVSVARMVDLHAISDVVVFPYRRISQSGALMTAIGLGRPTVITPIAGLLEQVEGLTSTTVADDLTGASLARALVTSLDRHVVLVAAAARDRDAIAASAIGWPAVATATLAAYVRPKASP